MEVQNRMARNGSASILVHHHHQPHHHQFLFPFLTHQPSQTVSTPTRLLSLEEARMRANPSVPVAVDTGGKSGSLMAASSHETSQVVSGAGSTPGSGLTPGAVSMTLSSSSNVSREFHTIIAYELLLITLIFCPLRLQNPQNWQRNW